MFKQKNYNKENIYNYLSMDKSVGTYEYWKNKFGDKFDDNYYYLMEVLSRKEYDDNITKEFIKCIKEHQKEENEKLINEYNEIINFSEPDNFNKLLKEIKYKIKLYE